MVWSRWELEFKEEFMIYPVESSSGGEVVQSPIIELLYIFRKRLSQEKSWVIIGSTFRDLTLASIMNDVIMSKNEANYPKVIHINPEAKKINEYIASKGYGHLAKVMVPVEGLFFNEKSEEWIKANPLAGD